MNNILKGTRCYLVGSIEKAKDGNGWRKIVEAKLKSFGITVFNPYNHPFINSVQEVNNVQAELKELQSAEKYDELSKKMNKIRCEDLRVVDISDMIFVYLDPNVSSVGSIEEITLANSQNKPIFLVIEGGKKSCFLWFFGMIKHDYIYGSINEALNMIEKINSGEVKIDSDRWRILRPEFL